ncbi:hypothetical protein CYY_002140 [Polysphondylium violaceum]|uniref:PHD-type domain-containing protein n=1 Tax=Polysphondylium violaceum TaxID=133409 RepID=A0A8J4Q880_9MYCE|nr:hypothetical protein CYY_002140 [Polysphondylium violaceum]
MQAHFNNNNLQMNGLPNYQVESLPDFQINQINNHQQINSKKRNSFSSDEEQFSSMISSFKKKKEFTFEEAQSFLATTMSNLHNHNPLASSSLSYQIPTNVITNATVVVPNQHHHNHNHNHHHHHQHQHQNANPLSASVEEEKPKRGRKNETICTICEKGGDLLMCDGLCLRSFHLSCLGPNANITLSTNYDGTPKWECDDCLNTQNICFSCKKRGIIGMDLMKCKVHQCGKFYHYKCVGEYKLAKLINTKTPRFNCPLHYCAVCEVSGDGKQSVHCFRCPTAYHVICMKPGVKMLTKSKETRKTGLVLCPKHMNEPTPTSSYGGACSHPIPSLTLNNNNNNNGCHNHNQNNNNNNNNNNIKPIPERRSSGNSLSSSKLLKQQNEKSSSSSKSNSGNWMPSTFMTQSPISSPPYSPVESPKHYSNSAASSVTGSPARVPNYNSNSFSSIFDDLSQYASSLIAIKDHENPIQTSSSSSSLSFNNNNIKSNSNSNSNNNNNDIYQGIPSVATAAADNCFVNSNSKLPKSPSTSSLSSSSSLLSLSSLLSSPSTSTSTFSTPSHSLSSSSNIQKSNQASVAGLLDDDDTSHSRLVQQFFQFGGRTGKN